MGITAREGRTMGDVLLICKDLVWLGEKKLRPEMRQDKKEHGQRETLCYI